MCGGNIARHADRYDGRRAIVGSMVGNLPMASFGCVLLGIATLAAQDPGRQVTAAAAAPRPKGFDDAWRELEGEFATGCRDAKVVGSSLLFVRGQEVLGRAYHGLADLETRRAVDAGTIFHWASITKTLTAIAVLQLRDRGLLKLSDPIVEHVPELVAVHNPHGPLRAITIEHLLSHAAGFRGPTWPWGGAPWHPHEPTRWEQLVAMLPYTQIEFPPGSRYSYSNPGIVFLGRAIERLTGDEYEVYAEKNLLRPLGMRTAYFDRTPWHLLAQRSNNYTLGKDGPVANGLDFDTGITVSNGGLNASLTDMAGYLAFLLGAVEPGSAAAGVLERSSLEEMWVPRHPCSEGKEQKDSIGLGFFVIDRGQERFLGHTGGQKAFITFFYVHPPTRTGALGAFNTSSAGPVSSRLRARMMDRLTPLFARG